ncbi:hypothetical protein [Catenulispora subtropica]|uniref:Uncharacterized protein n=1 Tax=Catenulispora subtropica TaxID=450798 RepID=A0ABP5CC19_9ACTN
MKYISLTAGDMGNVISPTAYLDQLPTLAASLPEGARAFATDPDHYNFGSKRCTKDLTLEHLRGGTDDADVWIELGFRHNCWKHEEDLTVRYHGIYRFVLDVPGQEPNWGRLGAVILDEILPDTHGCTHEIACLSGSITMACRDLTARWSEAECPDKPTIR